MLCEMLSGWGGGGFVTVFVITGKVIIKQDGQKVRICILPLPTIIEENKQKLEGTKKF